jgi:hypothetical protein
MLLNLFLGSWLCKEYSNLDIKHNTTSSKYFLGESFHRKNTNKYIQGENWNFTSQVYKSHVDCGHLTWREDLYTKSGKTHTHTHTYYAQLLYMFGYRWTNLVFAPQKIPKIVEVPYSYKWQSIRPTFDTLIDFSYTYYMPMVYMLRGTWSSPWFNPTDPLEVP